LHEFGHALGLEDVDAPLDSDDLMASRLVPGIRRISQEALDAVFCAL
jgi:hypothetical protein